MDIKKIKKYITFENILIFFIIIQPIIDSLTTLCIEHISSKLTVGIIFRTLFMIGVAIYSLAVTKKEEKLKLFIYYCLVALYSIGYILFLFKENGITLIFEQIKGVIKIFYFPILLVSLYYIFKNKKINIKYENYSIALLGYSFCILLSKILGIAIKSYKYGLNEGTAGLFYSANEIGAIIGILSIFLLIDIILNKNIKVNSIILILTILSVLELGTKVPFIALIGLLLVVLIHNIILKILNKESVFSKSNKYIILILIFVYLIAGYMPIGKNINNVYGKIFPVLNFNIKEEEKEEEPKFDTIEEFGTAAVSSRNVYFKQRSERYKKSNIYIKLFGLGYLYNNENGYISLAKIVEIDLIDVFFNHGLIGSIIFYFPMILIILSIIINGFKNILNVLKDRECITLGYGLAIILGMSLLAGHVITSPAVSLFVVLLIIELNNKLIKKNKIS